MKKLIAIVLALVCMLCFVGCSMFTTDVSWTDKDIKNAKSVEINCYDIQDGSVKVVDVYTIVDEKEVNNICNTFSLLKVKKTKITKPMSLAYSISFLDGSGNAIETVIIPFGWNVIQCGDLYKITDEMDINRYIREDVLKDAQICEHIWDDGIEVEGGNDAYLMEYTCTICGEKDQQIIFIIPPNNDILYVSSYPQDFEYNGKRYHLMQGDGLKTTATQKEVGGLLGYIIREEDISAFTREYLNVDYVIDNSIYDYYEGNRAAFYSLNAYPDLSIICMRQLGEYVLYQEEQN